MSRLDESPDVTQIIRQLERQINELKEAQIVGADVVKVYRNRTSNSYDWNNTVNIPAYGEVKTVVRFTPKSNQTEKITAGAFDFKAQVTKGGSQGTGQFDPDKPTVRIMRRWQGNSPTQEWAVYVYNNSENNIPVDGVRLKFHVYATGEGVITVV